MYYFDSCKYMIAIFPGTVEGKGDLIAGMYFLRLEMAHNIQDKWENTELNVYFVMI